MRTATASFEADDKHGPSTPATGSKPKLARKKLLACFACSGGPATSSDRDEPEVAEAKLYGPTIAVGGKGPPAAHTAAAGCSSPRGERPRERRLSSLTSDQLRPAASSLSADVGSIKTRTFPTGTDGVAAAATTTAADGDPASLAASGTPASLRDAVPPAATSLPAGPSNTSAFTEVFHPWRHPRKPRVRTSRVSPVYGTLDELSTSSNLSASASTASLPKTEYGGAAQGAETDDDGTDGDDGTSGELVAVAGPGLRRGVAPSLAAAATLASEQGLGGMEGEEEQHHPGMVTLPSFHKNESAASRASVAAAAVATSSGVAAAVTDDGMSGAGSSAASTPAAAAAPEPQAFGNFNTGIELERCPVFTHRGASCSGMAETPAGPGASASTSASVASYRNARRNSFAGDSSTSLIGPGMICPVAPTVPVAPTPLLGTSASLRPTPPSPPPPQEPQQLLQPCGSTRLTPTAQRPSTLQPSGSLRLTPLPPASLLTPSPSLRPSPAFQNLLVPSPSLTRAKGAPAAPNAGREEGEGIPNQPAQQPLCPSASLSRQAGDAFHADLMLRLPPPSPMFRHSPCSLTRSNYLHGVVPRAGVLAPLSYTHAPAAVAVVGDGAMPNRLGSMNDPSLGPQQRLEPAPSVLVGELEKELRAMVQGAEGGAAAATAAAPPAAAAAKAVGPEQRAELTSLPPPGRGAKSRSSSSRRGGAFGAGGDDSDADDADCDGYDDEVFGNETDSVVGDLPPPPSLRTSPSGGLHGDLSFQPMRRTSSLEPSRPSLDADLRRRTVPLSDIGESSTAGMVEASVPSVSAKWLQELLLAEVPAAGSGSQFPFGSGSGTRRRIVSDSGNPASRRKLACQAAPCTAPKPKAVTAAVATAAAAATQAGADSFRCLLREIE